MEETQTPTKERRQGVRADAPAPSPYGEGGPAYLTSKGWRCLGDPSWPSSKWIDPTQPLKAHYSEEPILYDHEFSVEEFDPATGQKRTAWKSEKRQVLCQDGRGGTQSVAKRSVYHPQYTPLSLAEALAIQIERDHAEELARFAEGKKK